MLRLCLKRHRLSWLVSIIIIAIAIPTRALALDIDSDQQLKYADALYNNQQYLRAAEEYQRFAFFFPGHPRSRPALFKAGESFLAANDPGTAVTMFKALSTAEPLDDIAIESYFKMADGYLALDAPTQAVVQLNNLKALSDDPTVNDRAGYRIGWIHIHAMDWKGAHTALDRISPNGRRKLDVDTLESALAGASTIPSKSPALAGTLSIVPGAGQLYCGRYEDALIAFAVNAGLIWAAHDAFDNEQYGLGGLIAFVGLGFYSGNIYGAVNDAHKYNHLQRRRFVDQLQRYKSVHAAGPEKPAQRPIFFSLHIPF